MTIAVDTSVAIPLLVRSHEAHERVWRSLAARDLVLTDHSLAETYSVLTRLPSSARLDPASAAELLAANFGAPVAIHRRVARRLPELLAGAGIAGGATYDALVALAARSAGLPLATRDVRASSTYLSLGVAVEVVGVHA